MNGLPEFNRPGEPDVSLSVKCLGQFQVRVRDRVIGTSDWDRRHGGNSMGGSLFAYLVAHRERPVPRYEVSDIFWRDDEGDKAATGLNRTISALRRVLEPSLPNFAPSSYIYSSRGCIELNPDLTIWLDAEEFVKTAKMGLSHEDRGHSREAAAAFQEAVRLYRGDYMQGVRYADLWCGRHRTYLQQLHTTILLRLANLAEAEGDFPLAIGCYQRVLDKETSDEEACHRLTSLLLRLGHRSEARQKGRNIRSY